MGGDDDAWPSRGRNRQGLPPLGQPHSTGQKHQRQDALLKLSGLVGTHVDHGHVIGLGGFPTGGLGPDLGAHGGQHALDGLVVLLRQDLGGGHQNRLVTGINRLKHGGQGHHGLARADLALEEALHGVVAAHVLADLLDDPALPLGQLEGQGLDEPCTQGV